MTLTYILYSGVADLVLGIGVFVMLACVVGAAMIFDSWLEEVREGHNKHGSR
jgi:hypothetical protein